MLAGWLAVFSCFFFFFFFFKYRSMTVVSVTVYGLHKPQQSELSTALSTALSVSLLHSAGGVDVDRLGCVGWLALCV